MEVKKMNTPRHEFCKQVLDFLRAEYQDAYTFEIEYYESFAVNDSVLRIKNSGFIRTISNEYMNYFYSLYRQGQLLEDRKQYLWQKELIDLIEGG
jgi:hypothetical protein